MLRRPLHLLVLLLLASCPSKKHSDTSIETDADTDTAVDTDTSIDTDTAVLPVDNDGDGYFDIESGGDDCDDNEATTHPGAEDRPADNIDNNCDGTKDDVWLNGIYVNEGDIFITEVMFNPENVSDEVGEWFEIYNDTDFLVDLKGLEVSDDGVDLFQISRKTLINPNSYLIMAINKYSSENGGVSGVGWQYTSFFLDDTSDAIHMRFADEVYPDKLGNPTIKEFDSIVYDISAGWPTGLADAEGRICNDPLTEVCFGSSIVLSGDHFDYDDAWDVDNWCNSRSPITDDPSDLGTPLLANDVCAQFVDGDGDDVELAVDCDDADPTIYPGAIDIWYDGIDSDCALDDDFDQDLDEYRVMGYEHLGVKGDDCDDAEPTTYPGATDAWYDGVDANCDGLDEYDADLDGYLSSTASPGGTDCNDDPTYTFVYDGTTYGADYIHPYATDFPDNGIDEDCSGRDYAYIPVISDLRVGDLVVTEIMQNPEPNQDRCAEWFEVYNNSGDQINIEGLVVADNPDPARVSESFVVSTELVFEPGDYMLFAISAGSTSCSNGGITPDYVYSGFTLNNTFDAIYLVQSNDDLGYTVFTVLDGVAYSDGTVDGATGTLIYPDPVGASMELHPLALSDLSNDDGSYWCDARSPFGDGELGTPGSVNDDCLHLLDLDHDGFTADLDCNDDPDSFTVNGATYTGVDQNPGEAEVWYDGLDGDCSGSSDYDADNDGHDNQSYPPGDDCNDQNDTIYPGATDIPNNYLDEDCSGADATQSGTTLSSLRAGDLVITEIMKDPSMVVDTYGEWFEIFNPTSTTVDLQGLVVSDQGTDSFIVSSTLLIPSMTYLVFGRDGTTTRNGGLTVGYVYANFALSNSSDAIVLSFNGLIFDRVIYDNGGDFPDSTGVSLNLNGAQVTDAELNDQGLYWCDTVSSPYGLGDQGTPGDQNEMCASLTDADGDGYYLVNDCNDVLYSGEMINPGVAENWGNEIDDNCDGNAFDEDWDGFDVGDDCDPQDPTIYPGAVDAWYDGVDSNCDEADDFDADADTYTSSAHGGTDCNDHSFAINPSATDVPDNGFDEDCNGVDATTHAQLTVADLAVGDLVISEVMYDPEMVADSSGEWFEIYNASGGSVELRGLSGRNGATDTFTVGTSLIVGPGGYVVFGKSADRAVNGSAEVDYAYGALLSFGNSTDSVSVYFNSTVIDTFTYGASGHFPDPVGASLTLEPLMNTAAQNDSGSSWCLGASVFGTGDQGTPGTLNDSCYSQWDLDSDTYPGSTDCDDAVMAVHPGATEIWYDGVDQNCDGRNDYDADDDGFGALTHGGSDCDDANIAVYPGTNEVCNGVDDDCDTSVDENDAIDASTWYADNDNDSYGDLTIPTNSCTRPPGFVSNSTDCNDASAPINPGAAEVVGDGVDQNCNGQETCYSDGDDDGYRTTSTRSSSDADCADSGEALSTDPSNDCDDAIATINPGVAEIPGDSVDQNCNGTEQCYTDADDDGYRLTSTVTSADTDCLDAYEAVSTDPGSDCNDAESTVHPTANEVVGDEIDQDCDGGEICHVDADNDTYRLSTTVSSPNVSCQQSGEATAADPIGDCNDSNASIKPGATEGVGDGVDQNCDVIEICYVDADNDTYRLTTTVTSVDSDCNDSGEALVSRLTGDCNDNNAAVRPNATEIVGNEVDDDCNTQELCYIDADNDGYRINTTVVSADADCADSGESLAAEPGNDCNDSDAAINPGMPDPVDTVDSNCDGTL